MYVSCGLFFFPVFRVVFCLILYRFEAASTDLVEVDKKKKGLDNAIDSLMDEVGCDIYANTDGSPLSNQPQRPFPAAAAGLHRRRRLHPLKYSAFKQT